MTRRFVVAVFARAVAASITYYGGIALRWLVALFLVAYVLTYIAALAWVCGSVVLRVVTT